jgi:Peptidase A4 family
MAKTRGTTALRRARTTPRRLATAALLAPALLLASALTANAASASPFDPSGVLRLVKPPHARLNTSQSSNWFGYNAGALERGGLFSSVASDWTVPRASAHMANQAENSATWIGIGGGCVDAGCATQDETLIQTGTEQDVDGSGHPSYSAWWELVPAPAVTISNMNVSAGDQIHASLSSSAPGIWSIALQDVTRHESFSTTVPYSSTESSAEWIEETPLTIGSGGAGEAPLPNLSSTVFDHATVNGAPAHLTTAEQIQLIDSTGKVIGAPSAPDPEADGFAACAWTAGCTFSSPTSGSAPTRTRPASSHRRHRSKKHKRHHKPAHRHRHTR